jgi:hypothetical protein
MDESNDAMGTLYNIPESKAIRGIMDCRNFKIRKRVS